MDQRKLALEIISTYWKHGWRLQRLLLRPETRSEFAGSKEGISREGRIEDEPIFEGASIEDALIDALWFSRPSRGNREAWELRLLAETQYALFETFERDEPEAAREEVHREMEARLRDYVMR